MGNMSKSLVKLVVQKMIGEGQCYLRQHLILASLEMNIVLALEALESML